MSCCCRWLPPHPNKHHHPHPTPIDIHMSTHSPNPTAQSLSLTQHPPPSTPHHISTNNDQSPPPHSCGHTGITGSVPWGRTIGGRWPSRRAFSPSRCGVCTRVCALCLVSCVCVCVCVWGGGVVVCVREGVCVYMYNQQPLLLLFLLSPPCSHLTPPPPHDNPHTPHQQPQLLMLVTLPAGKKGYWLRWVSVCAQIYPSIPTPAFMHSLVRCMGVYPSIYLPTDRGHSSTHIHPTTHSH